MNERLKGTIDTDAIRDAAAIILFNSRDILTLDYTAINDRLVPAVMSLQKDLLAQPFSPEHQLPIERELGVTLFFDVVNFCYKDPANGHEYSYQNDGKTVKRSSGLFVAMKESNVDWGNTISVASMGAEKWKDIIQLSETNTLYLGEERGERIRGFAKQMLDRGFKTVSQFLESTDFDSQKLLAALSKSGYFEDGFLKRAQLAVRMLHEVYQDHGLPGFKNTEILTAMADYRLPQVFYNLGAVSLSDDLKEKLIRQEEIASGSREEVALRATVIEVASEVSEALGITEGETDMLLWTLSQKMAKANELPIPHMIVATDKY